MTSERAEIPFKVPPVIKEIDYAGTAEEAFARFCERIGAWWPLATHSLAARAEGVSVGFERLAPGGRLVERWSSGQAHVWGSIVAIEPPGRIVFTWHVGRDEDSAQLIEVTFQATAASGTRVRLVHSGWERLGDSAAFTRDNYDEGWNYVLGCYGG